MTAAPINYNVGKTIINHPVGNGLYHPKKWCFGGWFIIVLTALYICKYILVGGIPTPMKNMSSSVGMMTISIYGKIKFMFQTTKQQW